MRRIFSRTIKPAKFRNVPGIQSGRRRKFSFKGFLRKQETGVNSHRRPSFHLRGQVTTFSCGRGLWKTDKNSIISIHASATAVSLALLVRRPLMRNPAPGGFHSRGASCASSILILYLRLWPNYSDVQISPREREIDDTHRSQAPLTSRVRRHECPQLRAVVMLT